MIFTHPEPQAKKHRILPVFLPFAGCPRRCIFCAQDSQTGLPPEPVELALARLDAVLASRYEQKAPEVELGFYGGTFTALPETTQMQCLALANRWRQQGMVSRVRCSTRPDAITATALARLRTAGLDLVELGVQTFNDVALDAAQRGCTGGDTIRAASLVRQAGLGLGLQLLPGMPQVPPATFRDDMEQALELAPDCLRIYPCLVLEGTGLAQLWRSGGYTPWDMDTTVDVLADALLAAWAHHVRVIRVGLTHDAALAKAILAGPAHPALGAMAKAEALFRHVAGKIGELCATGKQTSTPAGLRVPRRWRGVFWGHGNSLVERYRALGLHRDNVVWHDADHFELF